MYEIRKLRNYEQIKYGLLSVFNYLKDMFFPVFCLGCDKEGKRLCDDCYNKIDVKGVSGHYHLAVTPYHEDWLIGKIVRGFKYNYEEALSGAIEKLVEEFVQRRADYFTRADAITFVPLHKKRQAERGFNQSEFIARAVSRAIKKPMVEMLVRGRDTKHQARLDREERLVNVKDAFTALQKVSGVILLVDDVYTTGSTMRECTGELLKAGADKVFGFSLARG